MDGKNYLASGSDDHSIKIWDLQDFHLVSTLLRHTLDVKALIAFYDEESKEPYLASGSQDKTIKIWCLKDNKLIKTLHEDAGYVETLTMYTSDDQHRFLISGDSNGIVKFWNMDHSDTEFACTQSFKAHQGTVHGLEIIRVAGKLCLVTAGLFNSLKVWNLEGTPYPMRDFNSHFSIFDFKVISKMNKDSTFKPCLVSGDDSGKLKLWMEEDDHHGCQIM